MASDTPSIIVQSVRTSRSSFSSSNGYETPSHYSAITNGDDYDSDGSNFAPPTPMTLLNSIPAELVGAIPLIDKFQVEGFLRAMQKQINSAGKRGFFSKRSVGPQDRDKLTFEDMLCFQKEFVAHSANVNCLKIGKKTHRIFITGGDDEKVNLWSIGKPTSITSLSGHTSPIESVAFDSTEVLVAAGASSGVIKLWDLEETKVVRTLNGHRSYCTAVEFHPFGEFFASGSMDTNLKIWDIRKKGCIHTYKGHRRAVSTIRFSPDGRWVVSGGLDNVVKIWDLTAGKLLHDFKFHEGHIKSMDFHPLEFLLATGVYMR